MMHANLTLGKRIKMLRLARDLTLKQVSGRCGLSPTHLSEVERGKTSPTVGALVRIAQALGEDASRLIEGGDARAVASTRSDRMRLECGGAILEPLAGGVGEGALSVIAVSLPVGAVLPALATRGEQCLLVVEGAVEASMAGTARPLRTGDVLHGMVSDWGAVHNTGVSGAKLLWFASPAVTL
jgi:transcriptional regulator with XRE-family HTH domain